MGLLHTTCTVVALLPEANAQTWADVLAIDLPG
jgi:hypothetical protein